MGRELSESGTETEGGNGGAKKLQCSSIELYICQRKLKVAAAVAPTLTRRGEGGTRSAPAPLQALNNTVY